MLSWRRSSFSTLIQGLRRCRPPTFDAKCPTASGTKKNVVTKRSPKQFETGRNHGKYRKCRRRKSFIYQLVAITGDWEPPLYTQGVGGSKPSAPIRLRRTA